jgi:hypothetical protein
LSPITNEIIPTPRFHIKFGAIMHSSVARVGKLRGRRTICICLVGFTLVTYCGFLLTINTSSDFSIRITIPSHLYL